MAVTQKNRTIQLNTPLGTDTLLFHSLRGSEQLGQPYTLDLTMYSEHGDVDPDKLLGNAMTVTLPLPNQAGKRYFHGLVTEFAQAGYDTRYHQYRATLRPWLWFLTRTADCRIFQGKSIPEIFEAVVKEYRFTDYKLDLRGNYPPWENCVQYRETDFNFLSRLLEQEGIYYYFEHRENQHEMILVDDPAAHSTVSGYATVPYRAPGTSTEQAERDNLSSWTFTKSVTPSTYATTDFAFEKPSLALGGKSTIASKYARAGFEIFDYPAELQNAAASESDRIAGVRIQELHASQLVARGAGDAAGLSSGYRFKLEKYPRADLNIDYLIIHAQFSISIDIYQSGVASGGENFAIDVQAIDAKTPFRPPRLTPKPMVQGTQTAIVVGKAGEEIWTDKYGRVKVQFHWDRYGKNDENSSCWVRVAQVWAGDQWGAIHIPRIGQEVIVSFLEGDPDDPIITGRVYNGSTMPPYDLPANQTQSGIKSRSSKNGGNDNSNEIRFEDKKGSEELHIQAEKDMTITVKNDRNLEVQHDEKIKVANDRTDEVDNDETIKIGKDRDATVNGNDTINITKNYKLTAGQQIVLVTGSSQLSMNQDGTIKLTGVDVTIEGSSSVTIKAGQKIDMNALQIKATGTQVDIEGTQTTVKGTMLDLSGDAITSVGGGLVKIN